MKKVNELFNILNLFNVQNVRTVPGYFGLGIRLDVYIDDTKLLQYENFADGDTTLYYVSDETKQLLIDTIRKHKYDVLINETDDFKLEVRFIDDIVTKYENNRTSEVNQKTEELKKQIKEFGFDENFNQLYIDFLTKHVNETKKLIYKKSNI